MSPVNGGNGGSLGGSVTTGGNNGTCSTPKPNGGQCALTCNDGYMPAGTTTYTCDNGNWTVPV
jgi:hypothetical protein